MLKVKNIYKSFDSVQILHNININAKKGDKIAIFGESGCGKSVLLKIISGLMQPNSGSIEAKGKIGMLFQYSALFDSYTIKENIFFNNIINENKLFQVLELTGLSYNIANLYPNEISGGMKKRVALCRMIIANSDIMLFDEPTSGLDPINAKSLSKVISSINTSAIIITHDIINAYTMADYFILLKDASIIWEGHKDMLQNVQHDYTRQFFSLDR